MKKSLKDVLLALEIFPRSMQRKKVKNVHKDLDIKIAE